MDFREARSAVSFSGQVATSTSAPPSRQILAGQSKRQKPVNDVGREDTRTRSHMPRRETRFGSSNSNRELVQQEDSRPFTHPGELVICKKKRKDREKSAVKSGSGPAGPVSPVSVGRSMTSPGSGSISRETRLSQQISQQQGWANQPPQNGGGTIGWANPVKRMRTDAGKRRPSHM